MASALTEPGDPFPGRALVHPRGLLAAAALAFNVFWLRRHHPGLISGKLSDFAINFLLPVFVAAACEWALALGRACRFTDRRTLSLRGVVVVCGLCASYFALLKTWPRFTDVHRTLLGFLDLPFGGHRRFRNLADPTDLVALVMVPLAGWHLARNARLP